MADVDPTVDPYGLLGMIRNPDGSITRLPAPPPPSTPASSDPSHNPFHLSKDVVINETKSTWARIFVPRRAFDSDPGEKLPLIIYFHAGGFALFSASTSAFDDFYGAIVSEIPAVVVSVDYRLAPEHKLPAAYEDGMDALHWIKNSNDEFITKYADLSRCFLMGTSSGGNIVYNIGLRYAAAAAAIGVGGDEDLKPLQIKGLILHQPFFGGVERTESELRLANAPPVPLPAVDLIWEICLPAGVDRDHEYCNPLIGMKSTEFDHVRALEWKILVTGTDGDPFVDRQVEFVKKLEEFGVPVESKFDHGGSHAHELREPSKAKELCTILKAFVA